MRDPVTEVLRRLTHEGVRRLEHLEVLLLMTRDPGGVWNGERLAESSMIPAVVATAALEHLHQHQFLERVAGEAPFYRLAAKSRVDELHELRQTYERDRARVTNTFFGCNLDILRTFVEAFKFRGSP